MQEQGMVGSNPDSWGTGVRRVPSDIVGYCLVESNLAEGVARELFPNYLGCALNLFTSVAFYIVSGPWW